MVVDAVAYVAGYGTLTAVAGSGAAASAEFAAALAQQPFLASGAADARLHATELLGALASPAPAAVAAAAAGTRPPTCPTDYLLPPPRHAAVVDALARALADAPSLHVLVAAADAIIDAHADEAHDDAFAAHGHLPHCRAAATALSERCRAAAAALRAGSPLVDGGAPIDAPTLRHAREVRDNLAAFADYKAGTLAAARR